MEEYREIADRLRQADAILIGASNGFSIAEGLHIFADDRTFEEVFGDFKQAAQSLQHWLHRKSQHGSIKNYDWREALLLCDL